MADNVLESLSLDDLRAIQAGNVEGVSIEGLRMLKGLGDEDFNSVFVVQSDAPSESFELAPVDRPSEQDILTDTIRQNAGGFFEAVGLDPDAAAAAAANNPATKFMLGLGRETQSLVRGVEQLASNPQEALALAAIEESERQRFQEFDEGLGAEDLGESLFTIGSLVVPGANAVKTLQIGSKIGQAIMKLPGTLGGQAAMVGFLEGTRAKTADESRAQDALTAAGLTVAGGLGFRAGSGVIKNVFSEGVLGRALAALGVGVSAGMGNEARRRIQGRLASSWAGKLWPRSTRNTLADKAAALQATTERTAITLQRDAARAAAAEARETAGLKAGDPIWDSWLEMVKGAPNKTGRRVGGLAGAGGTTKAAKAWREANPQADIFAERNNIVSTLMSAAQREMGDGSVAFDIKAARQAWDALKREEVFKAMYGSTLKSGAWSPGKAAKSVDQFLDDLLKNGIPGEQGVTMRASEILRRGAVDLIEGGEDAVRRMATAPEKILDDKLKALASDKQQLANRVAGVGVERFFAQDVLDDAERNIVEGGWMGFGDYWGSLFDTIAESAE